MRSGNRDLRPRDASFLYPWCPVYYSSRNSFNWLNQSLSWTNRGWECSLKIPRHLGQVSWLRFLLGGPVAGESRPLVMWEIWTKLISRFWSLYTGVVTRLRLSTSSFPWFHVLLAAHRCSGGDAGAFLNVKRVRVLSQQVFVEQLSNRQNCQSPLVIWRRNLRVRKKD
jgi:hypothetical protein